MARGSPAGGERLAGARRHGAGDGGASERRLVRILAARQPLRAERAGLQPRLRQTDTTAPGRVGAPTWNRSGRRVNFRQSYGFALRPGMGVGSKSAGSH